MEIKIVPLFSSSLLLVFFFFPVGETQKEVSDGKGIRISISLFPLRPFSLPSSLSGVCGGLLLPFFLTFPPFPFPSRGESTGGDTGGISEFFYSFCEPFFSPLYFFPFFFPRAFDEDSMEKVERGGPLFPPLLLPLFSPLFSFFFPCASVGSGGKFTKKGWPFFFFLFSSLLFFLPCRQVGRRGGEGDGRKGTLLSPFLFPS